MDHFSHFIDPGFQAQRLASFPFNRISKPSGLGSVFVETECMSSSVNGPQVYGYRPNLSMSNDCRTDQFEG